MPLFGHFVALHFFIVFSMPFLMPLGSILPPNLAPQIHQNRWKIDAKMPSHVDLIFWSIFNWFLIDFSTPGTSKIMKFYWFYKHFCKIGLSKLTSIFDPILVPTWLHFPSQNPPKSFQKPIPGAINILIDFWMDFLSILAPTWDPTWGHGGHFFAQNGAA